MKSRTYPTVQLEPEWRAEAAAGADLERIKKSVELVGRLSDGLIRIGPWGIGIDGVLSWIPVVGEVYSAAAGAFILIQGIRARVPAHTLIVAAGMLASRTVVDALPIAGPILADIFIAHRWASRLVVQAIDRRIARLAAGGL